MGEAQLVYNYIVHLKLNIVRKENCMNKRIRALLHLIILCLGVILPSVAPLTQVQAAEFGDVITEMSLKNSSGGDLTQGIDIWETFRVYAKFVLPDNQVHQGDTTKITIFSFKCTM